MNARQHLTNLAAQHPQAKRRQPRSANLVGYNPWMQPGFKLGFVSQEQEPDPVRLSVEGELPDWLCGTLIRNGPGLFDLPAGQSVNHWFDGLAMLHNFTFSAGEVTYCSRFLKSTAFKRAQAEKRLCLREFATDPASGLPGWAAAAFKPAFTDNANVNIARYDGGYFALTETPEITQFDLQSLETAGKLKFSDQMGGQLTTAHPHSDFLRKCSFNVLTKISAVSTYQIYKLPFESRSRTLVAKIPVKDAAYMHSFAMTARYIILMEFPFHLNALEFLFSGRPFIENFHWSHAPSRLHVVDKDSGEITMVEADPLFCFHHVNAFEQGNQLILDMLAYPDSSIVSALYLRNLTAAGATIPSAKLTRLVVSLDTKKVARDTICGVGMELPTVNYRRINSCDYSFVYSAASTSPVNFLDQLVKVDLKQEDLKLWREDACYPGEPVLVRREGASSEDDGMLLSLVLDCQKSLTYLLVLDARTMQVQAKIWTPIRIPFGFHGQFFEKE